MVYIGSKLKELRKAEKITQQQLADALNISRVNYTRYETGAVRPDYETLVIIADFYDISLDELFGREVAFVI
ncbi:MAG: helix-turn-helix transcriptional regulator [Clostridia bacterium]|jgi:transcriptional regulator with XRE-family HTH domain|nr:helix-turn-helix transcriptional regulator [Clostridia bacterium]